MAAYAQTFADNDINLDVLPHLTEADLEKLGLSLGHRRKLQAAIQALPDSPAAVSQASESGLAGEVSPSREAERRQLTVMFCDLVGSTALSQELDPEDLGDIISTCHAAWTDAIEGDAGYVARYMGDGVLAYFGYPLAHEDDAERAVRAGLSIVERTRRVGTEETKGLTLEVRVGIATGPVVVGEVIGRGASQETTAVGETPNIAARLQAIAQPGQVLITSETRSLVEGLFDFQSTGAHALKGILEPIGAYRVRGETQAPSRFEARARFGLTPLFGRDAELGLLLSRWRQAASGESQMVLLTGEAGIGKSRLRRALQGRLAEESDEQLVCYCSPRRANSPLFPLLDYLSRTLRADSDGSPRGKGEALLRLLDRLGIDAEASLPVLCSALSLPCAELD